MKTLAFFALVVLAVTLGACRDVTAPQEKPCVPDFDNADSSMVIPFNGDTVAVIRIAWCGPITVR